MAERKVPNQPSASDPKYLAWLKEKNSRVQAIKLMRDRR